VTAREDFIRAMRTVAHSVTVVTSEGVAGRWGSTVSAFTSVSADPPSILVCLNADSRIAATVKANGRYAVNVLREGERALAERFAGRGVGRDADRFEGVELVEGAAQPSLAAAHTVFVCTVRDVVPCGTHWIVIGAVESALSGAARPLAYLDGAYVAVIPHTDSSDD
jgi:flavin reductase (DIM6/NTAB) family NADH-FMN oxidoreductase RutF